MQVLYSPAVITLLMSYNSPLAVLRRFVCKADPLDDLPPIVLWKISQPNWLLWRGKLKCLAQATAVSSGPLSWALLS